MRLRSLASVAIVALAVTAFTACGDDDDDTPSDDTVLDDVGSVPLDTSVETLVTTATS